jgi:transcriptional regulator with XRE-family HTH domain
MPRLPTPLPVSRAITELARQLTLARRRRRLTQESLAERMGVGVNTVRRLEDGAHGIALETLARALLVLGELPRLERLLAPETDALGLALANEDLPQRVRTRKSPAAL